MKKYLVVILFAVLAGVILPQSERIMSMGGLQFIMPDRDQQINPFDYGNNPAWLYKDEGVSWLKAIPSFSENSGEYKRRYDPTIQDLYSLEFQAIKTLGEDGTFYGETSYLYDYRNSVPRSLRYNTYSGDALFFADTTTGNFRYSGPKIKFMYSFEPISGLYTGASVRYRILDGLKSVYSRAESLVREVEGNIGAAYSLNQNFVIGVNYIYSNNQEKIEAKSEDLLDVEVYNYRGDTYAIMKRTDTGNLKTTEKGSTVNAQIFYKDELAEICLTGSIGRAAQRFLVPFSTSTQSFKEFEEGYSSFNKYSAGMVSRFRIAENVYTGAGAGYLRNYVWSKNSAKNLLLWEWETHEIYGTAGIAWMPLNELSIGAEYTFSNEKADSSKYIDNAYLNEKSGNHNIRIGAEYLLMKDVLVRAGYNISLIEKDLIYGGEDIAIHRITAGFGIALTESVELNVHLAYGVYKGLPGSFKRNDVSAYSSVKLYSF